MVSRFSKNDPATPVYEFLSRDRTMVTRSSKDNPAKRVDALINDVWYEILSRVPTKSLFISKCVCKDWCDFASHTLAQQRKMPFLPTRGVFFEVDRFVNLDQMNITIHSYLTYVSLTTMKISSRIDSCGDHNIVNYDDYDDQLLGNLSIDLNPLYEQPRYNGHKGLFLTVHSDVIYKVLNPATKQVLELPKPRHNIELFTNTKWMYSNAIIINLSCHLSSAPCSFVVMRFLRPLKLVDIYCPGIRKWVQCGFSMENRLFKAQWVMCNYVFLGESQTLFFMTNKGQVVALQFESLSTEPKICASYCLSLPVVVRDKYFRTRIGESQGCLYLSHVDHRKVIEGMWIWKHCGDFSSQDPWILVLECSKTTRLCKPVIAKCLLKYFSSDWPIYVMGFHLEASIVYIHALPSLIFAYDLTNDTLEEIAVLDKKECIRMGFVHSYTPCLASLGPFMA